MATPAAVLSILLTADSSRAATALRGYQAQLETANTHIGTVEKSTGRMNNSLKSVKAPADEATKSIKGLGKAILEAGGAFVAFEAAKNAVETTLELGHATERLTAITGLDTKTASTWIEAMKVRGVQAKQVNVSFITLSKNMRNAEEGSKTAKKAFDELGISQGELKNDNAQQAILQIADGLQKVKQPADRAALAQQLFGRGAQALIPVLAEGRKGIEDLLGGAQKFGAYLPNNTKAMQGAIEAQHAFALAMDGLKISFTTAILPTLVKGAQVVMDFIAQVRSGQGVGGVFASAMRLLADGAAKVAQAVGDAVNYVKGLVAEFQQGNPLVIALAGALAGVAVALGTVAAALKVAEVAQAAFDAVALANPYVAVAAAIAAFIGALVLLYTRVKSVHDFIHSAWEDIRSFALQVWPTIRDVLIGAWNAIVTAARAVWPVLKTVITVAFIAIKTQVEVLVAAFQIAFPVIRGLVQTAFNLIKAYVNDIIIPAFNLVKWGVQNILVPAFDLIKGPLEDLGTLFSTVFGAIKTVVKDTINFILGVLSTFLHAAGGVFDVASHIPIIGDAFKGMGDAANTAGDKIDDLRRSLMGLPPKVDTSVAVNVDFVSNISGAVQSIAQSIGSAVQGKLGSAGAQGTGLGAHAIGGLVTTPGYFAGEEAPAHPEVILATNPAYRQRNVGLWAAAGSMLGIPGFAAGGVNAAGIVSQIDPVMAKAAGAWMQPKAAKWLEQFRPPPVAAGGAGLGGLESLWTSAGGPANVAVIMAAIAMAESGGRNVIQQGQPYGTTGWGLWQITPGNSEPKFGVDQALLVPINNARAAVAKYQSQGLGAWTTYTSGAYKQFLGAGGAAVSGGGTGGLGYFDGLPVASWIIPELAYAQAHGWKGRITSGYRAGFDPHAPSGSEHALIGYPGGAVDFGGMVDPAGLANKLAFMNATAGYSGLRLLPAQGFRDDGHMSGTGHKRGGIHGKLRHFAKGGIFGRSARIPGFAAGGIMGAIQAGHPTWFPNTGAGAPAAMPAGLIGAVTGEPGLPRLPGGIATTAAGAGVLAGTIKGTRAHISTLESQYSVLSSYYSIYDPSSFLNDDGTINQPALDKRVAELDRLISLRQQIFAAWSRVVVLTQRLIASYRTIIPKLKSTLAGVTTKGLKGKALTAAQAQQTALGTQISQQQGFLSGALGDLTSAGDSRDQAWISLLTDRNTRAGIAGTQAQPAVAASAAAAPDITGLLQQIATTAQQSYAVSQAQYAVLQQTPPFGGSFQTGGVVPGPAGAPRVIVAHGGETVGGQPQVHIHFADGMGWLQQFVSVQVQNGTRGQSVGAMRIAGLPGSRGGL